MFTRLIKYLKVIWLSEFWKMILMIYKVLMFTYDLIFMAIIGIVDVFFLKV